MDVLKCIYDLDLIFPVASWKCGDIDIWPIVRTGLFFENHDPDSGNNGDVKGFISTVIREIKKMFLIIYFAWKDRSHNEEVHKADVVFWGFNNDRTIKLSSGECACQNLDMIKQELLKNGHSIYSLEYLSDMHAKIPRYTRSNLSMYWKLFKIRCHIKLKKNNDICFCPQRDEVRDYLKQNGFSSVNCEESAIQNNVKNIKAYADFFYNILDYTQAKMGITVCWYFYLSVAFIYACRRKKIPCVDVQHGLAGSCNHIAYASWFNVPINGYNTVPTNFWCWSDRDAAAINNWHSFGYNGTESAFVGGNNTQEYFLKKDTGNYWYGKIIKRIQKGKILILLTLQYGTYLPEWLVEFIKKTDEKFYWLIRCHPAMDDVQQKFIDKIASENNVEYEISSQCPLLSIIKVCDLHVTLNSSVVLNAAAYDVKSILLSERGFYKFKDNVADGLCFYAENAEDLNKTIERESKCIDNLGEKLIKKDIDMSGIEELIKIVNLQ